MILDPIADKILTGGALVSLSILGELPWWVTVLILVREFGITALRLATLRSRVIPASWGGKWKTVLQAVAITLFLLAPWRLPRRVGRVGLLDRHGRRDRAHAGDRRRLPHPRLAPQPRRERRPLRPRRSTCSSSASLTIAVAESLTGGLLVAELIRTPGASATVLGGIVAYDTELKHTLLGVDAGLLAEHGAVHPEVARQMAVGVRASARRRGAGGATSGFATTGVAGPDPQDGIEAGTVFLGFAVGDRVEAIPLTLTGGRAAIRRRLGLRITPAPRSDS